jgi:hypothetical protein
VLPTDGIPLTDRHWHTLDDAFLNVIEGIRRTMETRGPDWKGGDKKDPIVPGLCAAPESALPG